MSPFYKPKICLVCKESFLPSGGRQIYCSKCLSQRQVKGVFQKRKCLRCDQDFPSEGKHNRLCPRCKAAIRDIEIWLSMSRTQKKMKFGRAEHCTAQQGSGRKSIRHSWAKLGVVQRSRRWQGRSWAKRGKVRRDNIKASIGRAVQSLAEQCREALAKRCNAERGNARKKL